MKKEEIIRRYGKAAYEKVQEQTRLWDLANPEKVAENNREGSRKGGKYYEKYSKYQRTGLRGERNHIRRKHQHRYAPYKKIIAPESQLHHEWVPRTADYKGLALVEKYQHQLGYIDVIQILEGEITLLTEGEIKNGGEL